MGIFNLFKKKKPQPKPQPKQDNALREKLYLDILAQYEAYEQEGWIAIAPMQHRVTVAQQLSALFAKDADCLMTFFRGLALYATYQQAHIVTNSVLAKAELEAIAKRRQELGRDLTAEELKIAKMQAYADQDIMQVIDRDIWFDIHVITPNNDPVVIAHVENGEVNIISVKE